MVKKQNKLFVLPFILILTLIQTAISVVPGILFLRNSTHGPTIVTYMFIYLLICDFFQLVTKFSYKKGSFISIPVYGFKLLVSFILIFLIAKQTAFQFVIILLAYELFQLLTFSKQFFYLDSIFYSLLNAFFKGIVFNQLLTISYPFNYHFTLIKPFIISFLLILFITFLTQGMYSFLSRQGKFFTLSLLSLILLYVYLFSLFTSEELSIWKLVLFIIFNIIIIYLFLKSKSSKKKELILNLFTLVSLFIFYF